MTLRDDLMVVVPRALLCEGWQGAYNYGKVPVSVLRKTAADWVETPSFQKSHPQTFAWLQTFESDPSTFIDIPTEAQRKEGYATGLLSLMTIGGLRNWRTHREGLTKAAQDFLDTFETIEKPALAFDPIIKVPGELAREYDLPLRASLSSLQARLRVTVWKPLAAWLTRAVALADEIEIEAPSHTLGAGWSSGQRGRIPEQVSKNVLLWHSIRCTGSTGGTMSPALTVRQVARLLSVNERTVYRMAQAGRLPAFKVEGTWRFLEADIDGWIQRQKELAIPVAGERTNQQPEAGHGR